MRLAADNWCVKVQEKVYGPYSSEQLRKFAHEGRLAAWSLIAPAGSRAWREARDENTFSKFFGGDAVSASVSEGPSFGRRDFNQESDAETTPSDASSSANKTSVRPKKKTTTRIEGTANFIIIFDVVNAAASRCESAIMSLGSGFRVADNVWAVSCALTAVGVRNAISPYLRPQESIFVVDTTNGRSSWQNYAPELHAKITAAWQHVKH